MRDKDTQGIRKERKREREKRDHREREREREASCRSQHREQREDDRRERPGRHSESERCVCVGGGIGKGVLAKEKGWSGGGCESGIGYERKECKKGNAKLSGGGVGRGEEGWQLAIARRRAGVGAQKDKRSACPQQLRQLSGGWARRRHKI